MANSTRAAPGAKSPRQTATTPEAKTTILPLAARGHWAVDQEDPRAASLLRHRQ